MSDLQKAIDELTFRYGVLDTKFIMITPAKLKSLLEEVAREQLKKDIELIEDSDLVTDNLTFNEG